MSTFIPRVLRVFFNNRGRGDVWRWSLTVRHRQLKEMEDMFTLKMFGIRNELHLINILSTVMIVQAGVVLLLLQRLTSPYGRFARSSWGFGVSHSVQDLRGFCRNSPPSFYPVLQCCTLEKTFLDGHRTSFSCCSF